MTAISVARGPWWIGTPIRRIERAQTPGDGVCAPLNHGDGAHAGVTQRLARRTDQLGAESPPAPCLALQPAQIDELLQCTTARSNYALRRSPLTRRGWRSVSRTPVARDHPLRFQGADAPRQSVMVSSPSSLMASTVTPVRISTCQRAPVFIDMKWIQHRPIKRLPAQGGVPTVSGHTARLPKA